MSIGMSIPFSQNFGRVFSESKTNSMPEFGSSFSTPERPLFLRAGVFASSTVILVSLMVTVGFGVGEGLRFITGFWVFVVRSVKKVTTAATGAIMKKKPVVFAFILLVCLGLVEVGCCGALEKLWLRELGKILGMVLKAA